MRPEYTFQTIPKHIVLQTGNLEQKLFAVNKVCFQFIFQTKVRHSADVHSTTIKCKKSKPNCQTAKSWLKLANKA